VVFQLLVSPVYSLPHCLVYHSVKGLHCSPKSYRPITKYFANK
jgi:hypothetical protein